MESKVQIFNHVKIENEQQTLDGSSILINMIAMHFIGNPKEEMSSFLEDEFWVNEPDSPN